MNILRTPDERFANLPGYPYAPHYTEVPLPADDETGARGGTLRIHHVDEGPRDGELVLCIHGQPTWSYLYRHMIDDLVARGFRVVAPDLVGYGRSDKPSKREDYGYQRQVDWMTAWLLRNDFRDVTLVGQDWGGLIGLRLLAEHPDRFARVVVANTGLPCPSQPISAERVAWVRDFRASAPTPTISEVAKQLASGDRNAPERTFAYWQKWCWETEDPPVGMLIAGMLDGRTLTPDEIAAYEAPFPDASFKMGCRAMPSHVPTLPDDPSIPANEAAWKVLGAWDKPFLCAFSDNDPVTGNGAGDQIFIARVPGARGRAHRRIHGGGHFLQEGRGAELAAIVAELIAEG
ncbi:MAG: haloalkane dehalogenase [Myxococcota bacterium]